jgi:hypothetical protein
VPTLRDILYLIMPIYLYAPVIRITNSLTLGYPQEVPLQVTCARFILVQDVSLPNQLDVRFF